MERNGCLEWDKVKGESVGQCDGLSPADGGTTKALIHSADIRRVPVTFDQSQGMSVIRLEGEIDIASAAELKKVLLQALATGAEVRLDVERATELDVTALQLLWAAERAAKGSGRTIAVVGEVPAEILVAAREAGLEKFPVGVNTA